MVNWDRIEELRMEVGEDDLAEVILMFCEEVEEVLDSLGTAAPGTLAGKLHFLKGSALNIGLDKFSRLCLTEEAKLMADPSAEPDTNAILAAYAADKADLEGLL